AFIFTGPSAIQTGVAPGTIDPHRGALVRGVVHDVNGAGIGGVRLSVQGHAEYGQTHTRDDGQFDFVVNGGGPLVVSYEKSGLLPAQRPITPSWSEGTVIPEVIMLAVDPV